MDQSQKNTQNFNYKQNSKKYKTIAHKQYHTLHASNVRNYKKKLNTFNTL